MKQILIDYEEYLELEKAKEQINKLAKIISGGVVVVKNDNDWCDPIKKPQFATKIKLTEELETELKIIADEEISKVIKERKFYGR